MYCNKCGRLKEDCICNKKQQEKKSNNGLIIAIIVFIVIIVLLIFIGFFVFGNSKKLSSSEPMQINPNSKVAYNVSYYSIDDNESYIKLHEDNTFSAKRNYCSGFEYVDGEYIIEGNDLILIFNETYGDGDYMKDYFTISGDYLEYDSGANYMISCVGPIYRKR